jgi:dihydroneopterin aldolase
MSVENARAAYPILVNLALELSAAARERRPARWVSYDDFCNRCKEVGIKETPRTVAAKVLKPLQALCLEKGLPDLSALIIQKPKARTDFGDLHRPADAWWEPYVTRGETTTANVNFWFKIYQTARDYAEWPEAPFF